MFNYLRLFSLIILLGIIAMAGMAGMSFRGAAEDEMVARARNTSSDLAQGYVNMVWKPYRSIIVPLADNPVELRENAQVKQFAQETVRYFQQMPLARVNIYSAASTLLLTVNTGSTERLAGSSASPDSGFAFAQVKLASLGARIIQDVPLQSNSHATIMQTIVPIRGDNNAYEGAIEIVQDVTAPWDELMRFQQYGTGGVVIVFLMFLAVLYFTSRHASTIIARQYEANLELAATAAAAQAENRDKSQFLANVSHELRTPLNAIIGFSDIIKDEVLPQVAERKYDEYVHDIHASGVHLLSLINDILEFSKAEAGKLELEAAEINAHRSIQNCMRLVVPRAESGQVKLVESLPKEQFVLVTDGKKFKQILLNLLSNAVKFTPPGGEVIVSGWRNIADDTFTFEVRDTGIGIAAKDISRAMAPFGQVDNSLKRKYEGTGLGLPLTKKFVELMGGKFSIESEVNVGTTIHFTLPRELTQRDGVIVKHEQPTA